MAKLSAAAATVPKKATKTAKIFPKKSALSAEFIVDSDDSDGEVQQSQAASKPKTNEPPPAVKKSTSKAASKPVSKPIKKPASKGRTKKAPKPSKVASSSEEEESSAEDLNVAESDSSEDEEELPAESAVKPTTNGVKSKGKAPSPAQEASGSESESDSDGPEVWELPEKATPRRDNSESESDSEASPSPAPKPRPSKSRARVQSPTPSPEPVKKDNGPRPVQPFQPPPRFESATDSSISSVSDMFRPENTKGKQIWWITAPESVPISSLKEVALDTFIQGKAIITYNGEEYGFATDPSLKSSTSISLPGEDGYEIAPTKLDDILNLRLLAELSIPPVAQRGKPSSVATVLPEAAAATKPKKQQPKGLRMRYRPSGFGSGELGSIGSESDSDDPEVVMPAFRVPPPMNGESPSKKRKDREEDVREEATEKVSKKKKKKHADEPVPARGSETLVPLPEVNGQTNGTSRKKQKHKETEVPLPAETPSKKTSKQKETDVPLPREESPIKKSKRKETDVPLPGEELSKKTSKRKETEIPLPSEESAKKPSKRKETEMPFPDGESLKKASKPKQTEISLPGEESAKNASKRKETEVSLPSDSPPKKKNKPTESEPANGVEKISKKKKSKTVEPEPVVETVDTPKKKKKSKNLEVEASTTNGVSHDSTAEQDEAKRKEEKRRKKREKKEREGLRDTEMQDV